MAKGKRSGLTTDDLLRQQEERPFKRTRLSAFEDTGPTHSRRVTKSRYVSDASSSRSSASDAESSDVEQEGASTDGEESQSASEDAEDEDEDVEDDSVELREDAEEDSGRLRISRRIQDRTPAAKPTEMGPRLVQSFSEVGISTPLEVALRRMSIHSPTEIQAACIPPLLAGAHVVIELAIVMVIH